MAADNGYGLLDAKGLNAMLDRGEKFLLLDVRPDYEYDEGHIPGALNLEFHLGDRSSLKPAKAKALADILGPDKRRKVVIYCRSFKCLRSSIASKWAARLGYANVYRFAGGWYGWLSLTNPGRTANLKPPQVKQGDAFPACSLVVLQSRNDPPYLGLDPKTKRFALTEVNSPYVLVLLYSELCFACIEELPFYRSMYKATEKDPELRGKLKIIGMGAGSKMRKVASFRKKHHVPFPPFRGRGQGGFRLPGQAGAAHILSAEGRPRGGHAHHHDPARPCEKAGQAALRDQGGHEVQKLLAGRGLRPRGRAVHGPHP